MNFDNVVDRRKTNSVKWNKDAIESICSNKDALPFWVADMDFYPEEHIKQKAEEIASLSVFGYPVFDSFTQIASNWLIKKQNWEVVGLYHIHNGPLTWYCSSNRHIHRRRR